ncbi:MAG: EamA family transporter [Coleofasciculaceae cyanobacterium SM2_1_6]|nr:EamA family transporter [Coleofasciculaceae cyanobacterium SM2_1_6]
MTAAVGAVGQFFLKAGAIKIPAIAATDFFGKIWGIFTIPELLFGLLCYGLGSVGYVALLTRVPLSVVGPSIAMGYIFSVIIGYFWFREAISPLRLLGLVMIFTGVLLVILKK